MQLTLNITTTCRRSLCLLNYAKAANPVKECREKKIMLIICTLISTLILCAPLFMYCRIWHDFTDIIGYLMADSVMFTFHRQKRSLF